MSGVNNMKFKVGERVRVKETYADSIIFFKVGKEVVIQKASTTGYSHSNGKEFYVIYGKESNVTQTCTDSHLEHITKRYRNL